MAVFTHLQKEEIENFIANYEIGNLLSFSGIEQGIDNTNYKIETTTGRYILTVFESRIDKDDLPYFLAYMKHLSGKGITCPSPFPIGTLHEKPATLLTFLNGQNVKPEEITPQLCHELGEFLARIHQAGQDFPLTRANSMSFKAWENRLKRIGPTANEHLKSLKILQSAWPKNLPTGTIHADVFPDNVFIKDGHIDGLIDFYFSATDFLAYDLAIVVNAWCFDSEYHFVPERWNYLRKGYESIRPLTPEEKDSFQILCQGAALRFLSSRLHDMTFHDPQALVKPKPPQEYASKLDFHRHDRLFR